MELWTSWIQRRLEELQGRGNIATNNLILTVLKSAIRTMVIFYHRDLTIRKREG